MNNSSSSERRGTIDEDGLRTFKAILDVHSEYTLAVWTAIISIFATIGSLTMLVKLINRQKKCRIQFVIYISILVGNLVMAMLTMPLSVYYIIAYRVPLAREEMTPGQNTTAVRDVATMEKFFCYVGGYVYNVTKSTTLSFVCFFTVDRWIFLCFPFKANLLRRKHYTIVALIIWGYNAIFSLSPFFFNKSYGHREPYDLTCTWLILDIIPSRYKDENGNFSMDIITPYYIMLVMLPYVIPLLLVSIFSVLVAIELFRVHNRKIVPCTSREDVNRDTKTRSLGSKRRLYAALSYFEIHWELKISMIMLLTTVAYLSCYSLLLFFFAVHVGILFGWIDEGLLYSVSPQNTVLVKLFKLNELVGYVHAAIQPPIMYMILVAPKKTQHNGKVHSYCSKDKFVNIDDFNRSREYISHV